MFVAYSHSNFLRTICHNVGGASQFRSKLAYELLQCSVSDIARRKRPIVEGEVIINRGVHFGYGRCQKRTTNKWYIGKEKCPTMTAKPFLNLTISTRRKLIIIFQAGTSFVKKYSPGSFPEEEWNRLFPCVLNAVIKFPDSTALFGYYDIIISRNVVLVKQIDKKNDGRTGYDHCTVYSFFQVINGDEYRVSVVVTTHCFVGAVYGHIKASRVINRKSVVLR